MQNEKNECARRGTNSVHLLSFLSHSLPPAGSRRLFSFLSIRVPARISRSVCHIVRWNSDLPVTLKQDVESHEAWRSVEDKAKTGNREKKLAAPGNIIIERDKKQGRFVAALGIMWCNYVE